MRDDIDTPAEPQGFGDLPIQPTGSGVQDLEVAYEQMRLSETEAAPIAEDSGEAIAESEAHPS
ncbi:hypothetical protein [Sphingomonas fuzhouensis]|uniref:hypothetical protein n=1 Tax=Sphingomonas fuzhouensis TaxID=3106033 RepID=UPI002AFF41BD|nr:hypothetical protein [Sphingomonas sp. SGZ-02]